LLQSWFSLRTRRADASETLPRDDHRTKNQFAGFGRVVMHDLMPLEGGVQDAQEREEEE
jgi:hypothetical protein